MVQIPLITNWSVFPQNGDLEYFDDMNVWIGQGNTVISSANTSITKMNEAIEDVNNIALNAINAITFDNIAQLKLNSNMGRVDVLGYYTKGDGGGGVFYWDSSSTETDNGGTIIQATGLTTGRWKRADSEIVNVKLFGAKGDWNGVTGTDDTIAIQNALNFASVKKQILYLPAGKYLVTDSISIPEGGQILGELLYQYGKGFGINPKATSIKFNPTTLKSLFVFTGTLHGGFRFHNSVQNLYLEGNSTSSSGNSNYALDIESIIYATFKNISIDKSFRTGIRCSGTINNRFENVYSTGHIRCVEYAGNIETTDVWEQCSFWGSPSGIKLNGTTIGIRFDNCLVEQLDDYGFDISATTGNAIVSNLYCEDVPFATNNADASVFRVGAFGTSNKSNIQLTVDNGNIRGRNAGAFGSAFYVNDSDGVVISNTFARGYPSVITTTSTTRNSSIILSNFNATNYTTLYTSSTKVRGNYGVAISDSQLLSLNISDRVYTSEIRPKDNGSDLLMYSGTAALALSNSNFYPSATDNTVTLGLSNQRWSVVYAGTGTINTSDDRLKTYLTIEEKEKIVAKELKKLIKKYKFNDSIESKGVDKSRIHFGTSAQSVKKVFEDNELNPFDYALLCYDEWDEQQEEKDEKGNITRPYIEAGNRYGIRYDELLCFIMSSL